jgi:TolB protein
MNADGTGVRQLTDNDDVDDEAPVWSPNGKQIAFHSDRDGDDEIFVMNADGTGVRQLTDNDDFDGIPAWSPNGNQITFVSDRDGDDEIFVMNADGSDVVSHGQQGIPRSWGG